MHQRIREARGLTGLSQEALAIDLGVSRSAIAQWEMHPGGTVPAVENLIALARRSGMAFEYLATGRGARIAGEPILNVAEEPSAYRQLSEQQRRLLDCFDALGARQRAGLLDLLDSSSRHKRR
nr:helix-turn-helix domain-containing protein [Pseudoxanthomonas broegbernensis]